MFYVAASRLCIGYVVGFAVQFQNFRGKLVDSSGLAGTDIEDLTVCTSSLGSSQNGACHIGDVNKVSGL